MRILYANRHRCDSQLEQALGVEFAEFDRLLQESDFVTIHTPLSDETYHLFSDCEFERMKPSAILINTARGAVVDQEALYRALSTGQIAGAALDVTEPEPIAMDSLLLTLENLIIAPHIGSATLSTRTKMAEVAAKNLLNVLKGKSPVHSANSWIRRSHLKINPENE